ncbi:ATP-binding protein [Streptomyces sp. NPDC002138]|uniref:ATP-binding protein n=1 Tax=Streptomyces sp. NPDC002138 TaxID=3154410 RepID=UPI003330797A
MSDRTGRDLSARAATVAVRLADLLDRTCSAEAGGGASAFLRAWAEGAGGRAVLADQAAPLFGTPFGRLVDRFGLSPLECELVLLAGLPGEHEGLARTFRAMHPDGAPHPSVGLACLLTDHAGTGGDTGDPARTVLRRLLHEGAAVRGGVLALTGEGPFHERSLTLADQLWEALHGHPARPAALGGPVDPGPVVAGLDTWLDRPETARAVAALCSTEPRVLLVVDRDETVALSRCAALARAAGLGLTAARTRPDDPVAIGLLGLHAAVRGAVPLLLAPAPAAGSGPAAPALDRLPGPLLVCAAPGSVRPGPQWPVLTVPVGPIGVEDRRTAWRAALPDTPEQAPGLAARHPLDPALTAQIALDVHSRATLGEPGDGAEQDVRGAIRARAAALLPPGTDLLTPRADWSRLVLAGESGRQLRDAVARLRHQALVLDDWRLREAARATRGVRLLLTGPPGTGKSLAAEVLAGEAGRDLLIVDGSELVSKYIGETEKNLAACFEVAERTQSVFLLDEADALFATRTEVSEANDRFANMETAYLLQRLDRFEGLAVLTTNLRQNIDAAFIRRMDFVVDFPLPDAEGRRRLWELHVPPGLLHPDVDLAALARRCPVPGGWIRNAAIDGAFRAADQGSAIHQRHLVDALRREYAKAGRPFPEDPAEAGGGPRVDRRAALALGVTAAASAATATAGTEAATGTAAAAGTEAAAGAPAVAPSDRPRPPQKERS